MKKFLTASQIAKYEEVSRETVGRWIRIGKFPGTRKVGRSYKVPIDSYNQWREQTYLDTNINNNERPYVRTAST